VAQPEELARRTFITRALTAGAVIPLGSFTSLASEASPPSQSFKSGDWVKHVRAELPATGRSTYFQTGGVGLTPTHVLDGISDRLHFQNQGPADPRYSPEMASIEPALRSYLSEQFRVPMGGVALTHSTSEGISIAAWSRNWREGDEVVISNQEHPANVVPWFVLRDRYGIVIREINLDSGTDLIGEVRSVLSSRTRMVSLSHVSRNNGRRLRTNECAELASLLRANGTIFHLDGAQGPGCVPMDFQALGCDAYSTCGHKWLCGPKGTGALFVKPDRLDELQLSWAGSHSHGDLDYAGAYTLLPTAARYEFGTRALADFAGFQYAVEWMESLGWDRVLGRVQHLVQYAIERVQEKGAAGFSLASPSSEADRSGVFVIRLPSGCDATDVYNYLASEQQVLTSPVRQEGDLRLAIHFFNTEDEIDHALDTIVSACTSNR
jgi:L-cysteine/cystine lyase